MAWLGIGDAADHLPVCLYAATPKATRCRKPATTHVLIDATGHHPTISFAVLPTCDDHLNVARNVGEYHQEHPYSGWCGMPGSLWHQPSNRCIIDDSGIELPARATGDEPHTSLTLVGQTSPARRVGAAA